MEGSPFFFLRKQFSSYVKKPFIKKDIFFLLQTSEDSDAYSIIEIPENKQDSKDDMLEDN